LPESYREKVRGTLDTFGVLEDVVPELEFRSFEPTGSELLLGSYFMTGFALGAKVRTPCRDHYSIQFSGGRARAQAIGDEKWDSADPFLTFRSQAEGKFSEDGKYFDDARFLSHPKDGAFLTYKGRQLNKSGQEWGCSRHGCTRLSGDDAYAALLSYTGDYKMTREHVPWVHSNQFWGQAFVDIYDVSSGRRIVGVQLSLRGAPWVDRLYSSLWVGSRFFVLRLGPDILDYDKAPPEFLICDMKKVEPPARLRSPK
jgi:hypothetical protein